MTEPLNLIYGLVDPRTGVVRYVGQSTRGLTRPQEHTRHTSDKSHRAHWLRSLRSAGVQYEIVVLQCLRDDQPYEDIDAVERWWIAYGRSQGWNLTNTTDGGGGIRGYTHNEETRARIGAGSRARWKDPEYHAHMSEVMTGRQPSPETCRKISERTRGVPKPTLRGRPSPTRGRPNPHTAESRAKLSRALKGNTNAKGSTTLRGYKHTWVARHNITQGHRRRARRPLIRINLLPKSEP